MEKPILSLIIPVYNKAPFLRRCLDSVAKQMRDDVEVIVIDDASTDYVRLYGLHADSKS